jgi:hypothetical protein
MSIQSVNPYPCVIEENAEALARWGYSTPIHGQLDEKGNTEPLAQEERSAGCRKVEGGRILGGKPPLLEAINV